MSGDMSAMGGLLEGAMESLTGGGGQQGGMPDVMGAFNDAARKAGGAGGAMGGFPLPDELSKLSPEEMAAMGKEAMESVRLLCPAASCCRFVHICSNPLVTGQGFLEGRVADSKGCVRIRANYGRESGWDSEIDEGRGGSSGKDAWSRIQGVARCVHPIS